MHKKTSTIAVFWAAILVMAAAPVPAADTASGVATFLGIAHSRVVHSEKELSAAATDPDTDVIVCPSPIRITDEVDLGSKAVVAGPRAFVFADTGRLINGRTITRLFPDTHYPIFMNARPGRYIWYNGSVRYDRNLSWTENLEAGRKGPPTGTVYAPRHAGYVPPAVFGAWNDSIRDVTMWSQYHEGRHNDAIEAAQNSLPGKGNAVDRVGTVQLPGDTINLTRPIYYTMGMEIAGCEGNNRRYTRLVVAEDFKAPDLLYDIDDNFAIVGVPQNRNNWTRVGVAGGGGDGKSVSWSGLRNLDIETNGRCNGILVHSSMFSKIDNIHVIGKLGVPGYRGWVFRGSDDFKISRTGVHGFDVGYDFLGSCINIDADGVSMGGCKVGFRIQGPVVPPGRQAAIRINNANIEGCDLPFAIHRPRAILITAFTAQSAQEKHPEGPGYPVAVIDVSGAQEWPNYDLVFRGATTKGFDRIHVVDGDRQDVWRLSTRRIDNREFNYDLRNFEPGPKQYAWTSIDFNLNHEFGPNAERFRNPPATDANIGPLR